MEPSDSQTAERENPGAPAARACSCPPAALVVVSAWHVLHIQRDAPWNRISADFSQVLAFPKSISTTRPTSWWTMCVRTSPRPVKPAVRTLDKVLAAHPYVAPHIRVFAQDGNGISFAI